MTRYSIISCHVLWRELCYYASLSPNLFNLKYLEQGLHNEPDTLRKKLQQAIDENNEECNAILLGYGLCSNGLVGIKARKNKLVIMRGHDCITYFLGSKERYKTYFDANPGTYWYTPGWIETTTQPGKERWEKTKLEYLKKFGEDNAEYLMQIEQGWINEYSNAAYVDLGFMDSKKWKDFTKECAGWLKWNYDELEGDPSLIKNFVNGNWDEENFLIVEPGQEIVASHDEKIIAIKKIEDEEL